MTLNQLNKYAYSGNLETLWQNSLQAGDAILLIEEAILRLQSAQFISWQKQNNIPVYYLESDAQAYGLTPSIGTSLSDEQWVDTTLSANKHISW